MEPGFFEIVRDAFEGFAGGVEGRRHITVHSRGLKVWFDDHTREHYEAQLIRVDGDVQLEIGFHAEHPKAPQNDAVAGDFIGRSGWRRISEVWPAPDAEVVDDAIDTGAPFEQRERADFRLGSALVYRDVRCDRSSILIREFSSSRSV